MANTQQTPFPNLQSIMDLARAKLGDMYPGVNGQNGRIVTNSNPNTLPFVNSAIHTVSRKLRDEGVTFPIKDNVILSNLTAVQNASPDIQTYVGFEGYFDGTVMHPTPKLPSDCMQVFEVWEQTVGSALPFAPMAEPEGGLISTFQGPWLGMWEWRNYRINMVGSTANKNIRIRYQSGQPPVNPPPNQFSDTVINILDCEEAMACEIARLYTDPRTGAAVASGLAQQRDEAIDDMAAEWVRRQQQQNFRRGAYGGAGSNDQGTPLGPTGSVQGV